MRLLVVTFVILIQCGFLFGQDGGDMNYTKPEALNESYVGRRLHLDFYESSFVPSWDRDKRRLNTVEIKVNDKKIKFIEHRTDDGFNNWFSRQYLESIEKIEGLRLRIKEFELLEFNEKEIKVKAFFVFVGKDELVLPKKSFTKELSFEKKEIIELLFKAKD